MYAQAFTVYTRIVCAQGDQDSQSSISKSAMRCAGSGGGAAAADGAGFGGAADDGAVAGDAGDEGE